jgi:hypothetical protein
MPIPYHDQDFTSPMTFHSGDRRFQWRLDDVGRLAVRLLELFTPIFSQRSSC